MKMLGIPPTQNIGQLAFVGSANWDIYINQDGKASSIAKNGSGAQSSHFGDKRHIVRLIDNGYFDGDLAGITEYGRECFSGLYSLLLTDSKGKSFHILSWI
ncbi:hypothetical protein ACN1T8_001371 [Vibrio cholerae]|uniref:hypothetical protein n=1 Tax=Vibrio cholerae TaxID=666 RepID=UPI001C92D4B7|nr:hypothetical protein [Vibrio cholerae]MBY4642017.1 hypothetical protein [Vibrio cholerae]MCR9658289.1 hypothetical protein [Vibrio cholerae]MCR9688970.1 hypothetical protein [Vibrio cholerae]MCR9737478.1 hypothetical protein [Vibrio cholerae]MCR9746301.1 hypothetical protein [Vibrio cholerae]